MQSIKLSFKPLTLFPKHPGNSKGELMFDMDWLTSLLVRVHKVTGEKPEYILNDMSLAECCLYFAQYARLGGDKSIYRRTPEEILDAQDYRACELICERLVELKVISTDEISKYIKIMTKNPKEDKEDKEGLK